MIVHPLIECLMVGTNPATAFDAVGPYLESMGHLQVSRRDELPEDLQPYDVVLTGGAALKEGGRQRLEDFVHAGGGWLFMVNGTETTLPEIFGVQPSRPGVESELRVLFQEASDPMATRLADAIYVPGRHHYLEKTSGDVRVLLYADWHYDHIPVLTIRQVGPGQAASTTLQAFDHPGLRQIIYRLIRRLTGKTENRSQLTVGLLGYPPWLGRYHASGVLATAGLSLGAVCEISPERLNSARDRFQQLTAHSSAEDLAADRDVDLVFISTPPNTHCRLSLQMMAAGKHVVCEKPLALTRRETAQMASAADQHKVHLSCHQNRRWDVDYRAIRRALDDGAIGELFYTETFVGGFGHPCGYWHSHEAISGGLSYDWGGHYIDWLISLIKSPPVSVIATGHKRVWHDVTNADQERIQIRFAGDQEAEFIHSDIAAALKPKWYLLGTEGAIEGRWRNATALTTDPIIYYREAPIPITETPPELVLYRRQSGNPVYSRKLVLPQRQFFGFHRNLADHLLTGEPLDAPLEDSMTVIAILEAAARSAAGGGSLEKIDG